MIQVPSIMSFITAIVAIITGEYFALLPYLLTGILGVVLGQLVYRKFKGFEDLHLWDSMIIAAISWLICPIIAAIPFYFSMHIYVSTWQHELKPFVHFINVLFECFSGFTSTGLTMVSKPSLFPYTILWFRSFMQWVGGIGLIVFMISLVDFHRKAFDLYYSEARSVKIAPSVKQTVRLIWIIYVVLTLIAICTLWAVGMPLWEALNHAMCSVATGGFVVTDKGIGGYSTLIQMLIALFMFLGAMNFAMYYQIIKAFDFKCIIKDKEHRYFIIFTFLGIALLFLINHGSKSSLTLSQDVFQWVSALATCGYSTVKIQRLSPPVQLLLIVGMVIGGCIGSTAGGIKVHRILHVFQGMILRLKSVFNLEKSEEIEQYGASSKKEEHPAEIEVSGLENIKKLYVANILFSIWILVVFFAWIALLLVLKDTSPIAILFDIVSAISNVGLSMGVVVIDLPNIAKLMISAIMWLGRLEIIPIVILFLSFFIRPHKET